MVSIQKKGAILMEGRLGEIKKRVYSKPAVIFAKKIEVISAVCTSARLPGYKCRKVAPCNKTQQ
jgi:hypothetical protein